MNRKSLPSPYANLGALLLALAIWLIGSAKDVDAEVSIGTKNVCKTRGCKEGYSLRSPPPVGGTWTPFESDEDLVWAADVCLGYFLTKDNTAWNGGKIHEKSRDSRGLYLILENTWSRVHIYNYPKSIVGSNYEDYGVYACESTFVPWRELTHEGGLEVQRWASTRLNALNGWVGNFTDLEPPLRGKFRNDKLALNVQFYNHSGNVAVKFRADYFGPKAIRGYGPPVHSIRKYDLKIKTLHTPITQDNPQSHPSIATHPKPD